MGLQYHCKESPSCFPHPYFFIPSIDMQNGSCLFLFLGSYHITYNNKLVFFLGILRGKAAHFSALRKKKKENKILSTKSFRISI